MSSHENFIPKDRTTTLTGGIESKRVDTESTLVEEIKSGKEVVEMTQEQKNLAKYIEKQKAEKQAKEVKLNKLVEMGKSIDKQDALKFLVDTYVNDPEQLYWDDLDNVQNGKIIDPSFIKTLDVYGKVTKKGDRPNYAGYYAHRLEQVM